LLPPQNSSPRSGGEIIFNFACIKFVCFIQFWCSFCCCRMDCVECFRQYVGGFPHFLYRLRFRKECWFPKFESFHSILTRVLWGFHLNGLLIMKMIS
jgi:hypothetical protein